MMSHTYTLDHKIFCLVWLSLEINNVMIGLWLMIVLTTDAVIITYLQSDIIVEHRCRPTL